MGVPWSCLPLGGSCMWAQDLGSSVHRVRGEWVSRGHASLGGPPYVGTGSQGSSVHRAGSSSARTVAAGAALAEHQTPTSTHPGLWAAQDSARHATLSWEHLFLRVVPRPD